MTLPLRLILRCFAIATLFAAGLTSFNSLASASIVTAGNLTVSFNFTGFTGAGFTTSPGAGQLDSDDWSVLGMSDGSLAFGGTGITGDFARGASGGGVTTGGIYAFDVDSSAGVNPTLGVQPVGDDFTPGSILLQIINNTGSTITALDYAYTAYVRNDQARSNSFNFLIDADGSGSGAASTLETLTSAAAATGAAWVSTNFADTTSGLSIANGSTFYVLWQGDDVGGSVSRDEFALDDVSLTVTLAATGVVPEASAFLVWSVLCGSVLLGVKRGREIV